jgi:hypothetical protein
LLDRKRLEEVKGALDLLEKRQWSDEVGGLRAWAASVQPDYFGRPVVIFCVKNCTGKDIWYPNENDVGVVRASATDEKGQRRDCPLYGDRKPDKDEKPFARAIKPGEIVYLHPGYSWLDVGADLAPGKHEIVVSLENRRAVGRRSFEPREEAEVILWAGRLSAKPVSLVVPEKKKE